MEDCERGGGSLRCGEIVEAEVGAGGALVAQDAAVAVVVVAAEGEEGSGEGGEGEEVGEEVHFMLRLNV